jgi:DNA-binding LacI/PurR family transcriptional regulator
MRRYPFSQTLNGSNATMRDVAQRAGVSLQTVSNVVNGRRHLMTAETLARVVGAMEELEYHPNAHARGLRSKQSRTIGFLTVDPSVRFLADPFHNAILSGMADVLRENDYYLLIHARRPDGNDPLFQALFFERRLDGAVVHLSGTRAQREAYIHELAETGRPFLLIEERADCPTGACVRADNREGAVRAVEYLLERGHTDVAFLSEVSVWPAVEERLAGYREALAAHGLPARDDLVLAATASHAQAQSAVAALLARAPSVTAVLCANDLLAVGAVAAAKSLGRQIPAEFAVIGFDDFVFAALIDPPLTTVALPGYEMGRRAAELLLSHLQEGRFPTKEVVFPATLTVRNSA